MPSPILIAEQVETLHLKDWNLCPIQFSLPDRWNPYIPRTETCAWYNSHCRIGGNLTSQGLKPVPGPILMPDRWKPYIPRTKTYAWSNSHCRTGGNLTSQRLKPVLGTILIAGQVETLHLKDWNLCPVRFSCRTGGNLTFKRQNLCPDQFSLSNKYIPWN